MMKSSLLHISLLFLFYGSFAQTNSPGGKDLIDLDKMRTLSMEKEFGTIVLSDKETNTFLVTTTEQPKFIYNLARRVPLQKETIPEGSLFLLSFDAKTETASLETGEAKVLWLLKQSEGYKDNILHTVSLSSHWQTYYIPMESTKAISKDDLELVMQYGFREQSFSIKNIKFKLFSQGTDITSLPKTKITYIGMEEDAPWRAEAQQRIELLRKGNFTLEFTKNGIPIAQKGVQVKLIQHGFRFGAAMDAQDIVAQNEKYQNFKKGFHYTVLANDLKIKSWSNANKRETTLKALEILKRDHIEVKGHVLIWPGFQYLTPEVHQNKDNPKKVADIVGNHVKDVLKATQGYIRNWDVVNEAYTNRDLQEITGSEDILYNGFRLASEWQPQAFRYTNEYGIISKGGIDTQKQLWYYDYIKRIDENTQGLVQGVGIQSHIGSDLTPPERVLEILAYYATLGKSISISEFTMDIQDPAIRAQYTRDFMIAAFSHPSVTEFLFWGCTDDERKKVDIFTEAGDIGIMGAAYFSLLNKDWHTELVGETNDQGIISGRGFYGTYEYSYVEGNQLIRGTFELVPRGPRTIKLQL